MTAMISYSEDEEEDNMTTSFDGSDPNKTPPRFIVNEMGDGMFQIFQWNAQIGYRPSRIFPRFWVKDDAVKDITNFEAEEETQKLRNTVVRRVYP